MLVNLGTLPPVNATARREDGEELLMAELRATVEERLAALLPADGQNRVAAAMRYGTLAPGKRVRPLLLLVSAKGLGLDPYKLVDVACALEMVHAASLFLDDMPCMDDAQLRRGQPTVHVAYGEDVAMLGAVALLACAWRTTATAPHVAPLVRTEMVGVLSDAVGLDGLVTGQYRDLHEAGTACTTDAASATNEQKTGALFAAAFELAGLAAGASDRTRDLMREAAGHLGQAFQLADDLADVEMDPASLGKDCHQDVGKSNLVALLGHAPARQRLQSHVERARSCLGQAIPADKMLPRLTRSIFGM